MTEPLSVRLSADPWPGVADARRRAADHPDGAIDLSIGAPVDPTPQLAVEALSAAGNSPGYPTVAGAGAVRDAIAGYLHRRCRAVVDPSACMPTIGTKELIGLLPTLLDLTPDDLVVIPAAAYPTYRVGAQVVGCEVVATDDLTSLGDRAPKLVWLNYPGNPTGRIPTVADFRSQVAWARERGAIVASDECYLEFGWDAEAVSVLDEQICGGDQTGLLAVHSLSKTGNFAGGRFGFAAGDAELIADLTAIRRHLGMMVPRPVQQAAIALLGDDDHVRQQRERYAGRRVILRTALEGSGWQIDDSEGGLYLWARNGTDCWTNLRQLADRGIVVAPGQMYGDAGRDHVRFALTATDQQISAAAERLIANWA